MRIREIDFARGFTVLIMPAVHALLLYSPVSIHAAATGKLMGFLAEGPGAPIFMTVMGASFVFSKHNDLPSTFKRAGILLMAAYILNFFKFLIPLAAGWIPTQLLSDFNIPTGTAGMWHLLLMGDILHLAAISLFVLALVYLLPYYQHIALFLAFAVALLSPLLWGYHVENKVLNYVGDLLWGNNSKVFFPVFPWITYPLLGLALGYYLKSRGDIVFTYAGIVGILLVATGRLISASNPAYHWGDFYRAAQGGTLYYMGFLLCWLYGWHLAARWIPNNGFFHFLEYLSRHITTIYLVQWVLIFWLLGVIGYRQLNTFYTWVCMIAITGLVFLLNGIIIYFSRKQA
jgi:hypothetical protein